MQTRALRTLALGCSLVTALAVVRCVRPPTGARFLCEDDQTCRAGEECRKGDCWPLPPDTGRGRPDAALRPDAAADEDAAPTVGDDAAVDEADADVIPDGDGGLGDAGPGCPVTHLVGTGEADTLINVSGNNLGQLPIANFGAGWGLLRFGTSSPVANSVKTGKYVTLKVTLTRVDHDDAGCGGSCPAGKPGTVTAYPLRTDWIEGTGDNRTGVTWTHRSGDNIAASAWGTPGAQKEGVDRGGIAGTQVITGSEAKIAIELDPAVFAAVGGSTEHPGAWIEPDGTLSILFGSLDNAGSTVATKENLNTGAHPKLDVYFCP